MTYKECKNTGIVNAEYCDCIKGKKLKEIITDENRFLKLKQSLEIKEVVCILQRIEYNLSLYANNKDYCITKTLSEIEKIQTKLYEITNEKKGCVALSTTEPNSHFYVTNNRLELELYKYKDKWKRAYNINEIIDDVIKIIRKLNE